MDRLQATAVVLAGGGSRRMGADKGLLSVEGRTLVERAVAALRGNFAELLVSTNTPDAYAFLGLPVVVDPVPGLGPLGGILAALRTARHDRVLVVACDIPELDLPFLRALVDAPGDWDARVPVTPSGVLQPTLAAYRKSFLPHVEAVAAAGRRSVLHALATARTERVSIEDPAWLWNLNTPADVAAFLRRAARPAAAPFPHPEETPMLPKALSIVARSGTGKTTLLEKLVPELQARGLRVAVIKHDAHRFDIDHPGKDSHRLFAAGADAVMLASPEKVALVKRVQGTPPVRDAIAAYLPDMDLVLTEGFKQGPLPRIELHRAARSPSLLCRGEAHDPLLVAVASDTTWDLDVPVLPLGDVSAIADFVVGWMARAD